MNKKRVKLSERYLAALRAHLKPGSPAIPPGGTALQLGREAVALGLETLDLARIHEHALVALDLIPGRNRRTKRADLFFAETLIPIEETHSAAQQGTLRLKQMAVTLKRRTKELEASKRQLNRGSVRRKVMKDASVLSDKRHDKSLEESLQLQNRLRQLTHKVLAAQEDERKKNQP